uniref:SMB domain-containing protein n=1 Tax=Steinernema glaseri TaxID=37863 RepID=A0A1I8A8L8_9BILA
MCSSLRSVPLITLLLLCSCVFAGLIERRVPPVCPQGSRPMLRPDGLPRKCLPHQNSLCVNALTDKPNANTVCCWHNQVDYHCCLDVTAQQCPDYNNVTVVIHNAFPQSPFAARQFHFREGIEDEVAPIALAHFNDNEVQNQQGFLVRHQRTQQ